MRQKVFLNLITGELVLGQPPEDIYKEVQYPEWGEECIIQLNLKRGWWRMWIRGHKLSANKDESIWQSDRIQLDFLVPGLENQIQAHQMFLQLTDKSQDREDPQLGYIDYARPIMP